MQRTLLAVCAIGLAGAVGCNGGTGEFGIGPQGITAKVVVNCPPGDGGKKPPQSTGAEAQMPCKPLRVYDGDLQGPGSGDIFGYASTQDFSVVVRVTDLSEELAATAEAVFRVDGNEATVHTPFDINVDSVTGVEDLGSVLRVEDQVFLNADALLNAPTTMTVCVPADWVFDYPEDPDVFIGVEITGTLKQVLGYAFLELGDFREFEIPVQPGAPMTKLILRHDPATRTLSALTLEGGAVREQLRVPLGSIFATPDEPVAVTF